MQRRTVYAMQSIQKKNAFSCISVALSAGLLMCTWRLCISGFLLPHFLSLTGVDWLANEVAWILTESVLYILILALPAVFLLAWFKQRPLSGLSGPLATPNLPFLYIPLAIGIMYVVNMVVNEVFGDLLTPFDTPVTAESYPHTTVGVILYLMYIAILPAILEEWLFRGILQKNLIPAVGQKASIVISSLIFGLMHLDPGQSVFAFGFGLFVGYAYCKTGSIWFGALMHMLNNALSACIGYWYYVYDVESVQYILSICTLLIILLGVIAVPIYIFWGSKHKKAVRMTAQERTIPSGGKIFRITVINPWMWALCGTYVFLLWVYYFL